MASEGDVHHDVIETLNSITRLEGELTKIKGYLNDPARFPHMINRAAKTRRRCTVVIEELKLIISLMDNIEKEFETWDAKEL